MFIKKLLLLVGLVFGYAGHSVSIADPCIGNYHRHPVNSEHVCQSNLSPEEITFNDSQLGEVRPVTNSGGCGGGFFYACNGMELMNALAGLGVIKLPPNFSESDLNKSLGDLLSTSLSSEGISVGTDMGVPTGVMGSTIEVSLTEGDIQAVTASAGQIVSEATIAPNLEGTEVVEIGGAAFDAAGLEKIIAAPTR